MNRDRDNVQGVVALVQIAGTAFWTMFRKGSAPVRAALVATLPQLQLRIAPTARHRAEPSRRRTLCSALHTQGCVHAALRLRLESTTVAALYTPRTGTGTGAHLL